MELLLHRILVAYLRGSPTIHNHLSYLFLSSTLRDLDHKPLRSLQSILLSMDLLQYSVFSEQLICLFVYHKSFFEASLLFCLILEPTVRAYHALMSSFAKHGNGIRALSLYIMMLQEGLNPNEHTFPCILKVCGDIIALEEGQYLHHQLVIDGYETNVVVGNTLIDMYSKCGWLKMARSVFDKLPNQSLFSWSSIIAAYTQHGYGYSALVLFQEMQEAKVQPDIVIYSCILKACCILKFLQHGEIIHDQIIKSEIAVDVAMANTLIDMYGKCGKVTSAINVFDRLPFRNTVSWGSIIAVHTQNGQAELALEVLDRMRNDGITADKVVYLCTLQACSGLTSFTQGKLIHNQIIECNLETDIDLRNSLLEMYSKCGRVNEAFKVFNRNPNGANVAMMAVYSENGLGFAVLKLFEKMQQQRVQNEKAILCHVLKACGQIVASMQGRLIHNQILNCSLESDLIIGNNLIDMYCKCRRLKEARNVLDRMRIHDVVSWGSMMSGYVKDSDNFSVIHLFEEMQKENIKPDGHVFSCILKACAQSSSLSEGEMLFCHLHKSGLNVDEIVAGTFLDLYASCGHREGACKVFASLGEQRLSVWGPMIARCVQQGDGFLAINLYYEMERLGVDKNEFIMSSSLKACAMLGAACQGKLIHDQIIRDAFESNAYVENTLIDMYIKSGNINEAIRVFQTSSSESIISWGALIAGYAEYGDTMHALKCFHCMKTQGLSPDASIYASMLATLGHAGQIDKVCQYNNTMNSLYGVEPMIKHFNCIVDIYARAGYLEEAEQLLECMPNSPDLYSEASFINALKVYGT